MAEELSPEAKIYVKEEIEKVRNEFKEDLEEARTKATKTFTTVAIVVGLVAGFGAYFSMESTIQQKLSEEGWTNLKKQAEDANDTIQKIKLDVQETAPMLLKLKRFDQKPVQDGFAWIGEIALIWGTRTSTHDDDETFYIGWEEFNNDCFTVITSLPGEVKIKDDNKRFTLNRMNDYDYSHKFTYLAIGH